MKLSFLLLFLSLSWTFPSEKEIPYRALTWADFRAPVPYDEPFIGARTHVEINLVTFEANGVYRFKAKAYFLPDSSFVREKTDDVLRHEQTHFQIGYIASLRCNRDLRPLQEGDVAAKKEAERIYNHYCDERDAVNADFDNQTNHHLNKEAEKEWEQRISKEMSDLVTSLKRNDGRNR